MQEVFEKIIEKLNTERNPIYRNDGSVMGEKRHIEINRVIEIVKQVAAEYNNGWIPCGVVDHPEHCRECEVTMIDKYGHTRDIAFYTDRWRRASDEAEIIVIAWKEPSDPYHPKGE